MNTKKQCAYSLLIWAAVMVVVPTEEDMNKEMASVNAVNQEQHVESLRPKMAFDDQSKDPFTPKVARLAPVEPASDTPAASSVAPPPPVVPPSLTVQGIIWGGLFNQAIVNDTVVRVGDSIAGARLTKIEKEGITILYQDKEFSFPPPAGGLSSIPDANLKGGSDGKNK